MQYSCSSIDSIDLWMPLPKEIYSERDFLNDVVIMRVYDVLLTKKITNYGFQSRVLL